MSKFNFSMELSGGLQHLFDGEKEMEVSMEVNSEDEIKAGVPIKRVIKYIHDNLVQERPELFMKGDSVCPGILVLINDVDWELEGGIEYTVQAGDRLVFISTLHGG